MTPAWFVIATAYTLFWGNGGIEEARTDWELVFYGSSSQCEARARDAALSVDHDYDATRDQLKLASVENFQQPGRFNKGVKAVTPARGFCVPFESARQIKDFLPNAYVAINGVRTMPDGKEQSFAWWDGADGEALK